MESVTCNYAYSLFYLVESEAVSLVCNGYSLAGCSSGLQTPPNSGVGLSLCFSDHNSVTHRPSYLELIGALEGVQQNFVNLVLRFQVE